MRAPAGTPPAPVALTAATTSKRQEPRSWTGSMQGLQLTVADVDAASAELIARGADVSEVFHDAGGVFHHPKTEERVPGPAPDHNSYGSPRSATPMATAGCSRKSLPAFRAADRVAPGVLRRGVPRCKRPLIPRPIWPEPCAVRRPRMVGMRSRSGMRTQTGWTGTRSTWSKSRLAHPRQGANSKRGVQVRKQRCCVCRREMVPPLRGGGDRHSTQPCHGSVDLHQQQQLRPARARKPCRRRGRVHDRQQPPADPCFQGPRRHPGIHQFDSPGSQLDRRHERASAAILAVGRRREIAVQKMSKQRAVVRRGCDRWSSRPGPTGPQQETTREQQCGF
jgi:hypothetical protein